MEKKVILLVEDNPDDEELTLLAFKKHNIVNDVFVVRDGAEALDYMFGRGQFSERDLNNTPTLILLDLKLPKVDGLEVLRQLRANESTKYLPIVILTSSREEKDLLHGYFNGANSYVVKPVEFEEFIEAIGKLGLYWMLLNERMPRVGEK